ncbi:MAG: extracellular solute-binding protein [bacterium]|nr:extracellular solute-binding protein [bacterium]
MQTFRRVVIAAAVSGGAAFLAACGSIPFADNAPTLTQGPLQTSEITPEVQLTLPPPIEITPSVSAPITLRVWLPEPLAPVDNEDAAELLSEQISGFLAQNPDLQIDLRLKRPSDAGGILDTIRSASAVAPDALPDLTLMRRSDLAAAVEGGYLETLDTHLPAGFLDRLVPFAGRLGQVDERMYGIAYALDVVHVIHMNDSRSPGEIAPQSFTFDAVLSSGLVFMFPVNRPAALNETLHTQLIAAGASFDSDGGFTIDAAALENIFAFYEQAAANGQLPAANLTASDPAELLTQRVQNGSIRMVTARLYRALAEADPDLAYAPIPTLSGTPATAADGWMWVLVTGDAQRQAAASRFLLWMLDAERQRRYTDATAYIPSLIEALESWENQAYAGFIERLLANAAAPLTGNAVGAGRAIQAIFIELLSEELDARSAADAVIAALDS